MEAGEEGDYNYTSRYTVTSRMTPALRQCFSLIVRDKVTRQCPTNHNLFEEKGEPKLASSSLRFPFKRLHSCMVKAPRLPYLPQNIKAPSVQAHGERGVDGVGGWGKRDRQWFSNWILTSCHSHGVTSCRTNRQTGKVQGQSTSV